MNHLPVQHYLIHLVVQVDLVYSNQVIFVLVEFKFFLYEVFFLFRFLINLLVFNVLINFLHCWNLDHLIVNDILLKVYPNYKWNYLKEILYFQILVNFIDIVLGFSLTDIINYFYWNYLRIECVVFF